MQAPRKAPGPHPLPQSALPAADGRVVLASQNQCELKPGVTSAEVTSRGLQLPSCGLHDYGEAPGDHVSFLKQAEA